LWAVVSTIVILPLNGGYEKCWVLIDAHKANSHLTN
jgi:hypothetical protein